MTAPPWWEPFTDVVPDWFRTYLTVEPAASVISTHEAQFLPGLFQTADYARAVIGLAHPDPVNAERGSAVFNGAGQCATCHVGPLFTDANERLPMRMMEAEKGRSGKGDILLY